MAASKTDSQPLYGFIRVSDLGASTLIGGYLILNALGRPLEFHCTEPVKPNRAQQILFGDVLEPYLYGEQIAKTLVTHSQLIPDLIVSDQVAVLSLRPLVETPVVWIARHEPVPAGCQSVSLGEQQVWLGDRFAADRERIARVFAEIAPDWNLVEPFERIDEAVRELQKAA